MITAPRIPLEHDWHCRYVPPTDSRVPASAPFRARLGDWVLEQPMTGWRLVCEREFTLEPLDLCVRYLLHLRDMPGKLEIFLRGEPVGVAEQGSESFDVTDYVLLDENHLVLSLDLSTVKVGNRLGDVWLQAVPCE